jgi:hypothetical protein
MKDSDVTVQYSKAKMEFGGRFRHFSFLEATKKTCFPSSNLQEKNGKAAEKLSLLALSALSLVSESLPGAILPITFNSSSIHRNEWKYSSFTLSH